MQKNSLRKCLLYKKHGHVHIFGYSDSGYADDKIDKKSTTGYCNLLEEIL